MSILQAYIAILPRLWINEGVPRIAERQFIPCYKHESPACPLDPNRDLYVFLSIKHTFPIRTTSCWDNFACLLDCA